MRFLDAAAVAALGPAAAVEAVSAALRGGFDPADDPARIRVDLAHGHFLLMPSSTSDAAGVKVATVAPGNADLGLPRIQATYLLFDATTLALRAALDGTALTTLRTPAVSIAAVLPVLPDRPLTVAVVGAGPQARGHAATLAAVRELAEVTYLVRDPAGTELPARRLGSADAAVVLARADVVVCATSARTPVFDSALLRDDVVVVAVGSHEPDLRELDAALMSRSTVVVESLASATREAGDVVLAVAEGAVSVGDLVPMRDVVAGAVVPPPGRPVVFKGVGMSWQDLVVAEAVVAATSGTAPSG
ncbi:ornithine cyclodeaminase family protein [Jatrophihabitans sp. YIM 134969]